MDTTKALTIGERFNKYNVSQHIFAKIDELYEEWGFDENNGNAQVRHATDVNRILAYGELQALEGLVMGLNLSR